MASAATAPITFNRAIDPSLLRLKLDPSGFEPCTIAVGYGHADLDRCPPTNTRNQQSRNACLDCQNAAVAKVLTQATIVLPVPFLPQIAPSHLCLRSSSS